MQRAQPSRQLIEQHRPPRPVIQKRMQRRDEEIEGHTPEGQVCEEVEGAAARDVGAVAAVPAKDEERAGEDVQGDEGAGAEQDQGRKGPRRLEGVQAVVRWVGAHQRGEGATGQHRVEVSYLFMGKTRRS